MVQFAYSFCMTLLHSLWQAALLVLLYIAISTLISRNAAPIAKRNFLYAAITTQFVLSVTTFLLYFFNTTGLTTFIAVTQDISTYLERNTLQLITPWLFGLYIFIIAFKLVKAFYCWYRFKQLYTSGLQKPPVNLKLFTESKANQFGIKRKVKLWLSSSVNTPITFGFLKPVILLPVALVNHINIQQAETLILHELTHIHTNDYLLNWVLLIGETIFFFNPFVMHLCSKIRLEREKHCDIQVMSFKYSPALYAQTLLQAERMKQLVPNFQLAAVNRKKHLLQRIQFFTSEKNMQQAFQFNIVAPVIGLLLLSMLSAAVLFQSQQTTISTSAADNQYLPFNNYIIPNTEVGKPFITPSQIPTQERKNQFSNKPAIDIKVQPQPGYDVEISPEENTKSSELNYCLPITTMENDASRQIIIKEEGQDGTSLKVYQLSFSNGKWILQPEWIITAKALTDSLSIKIDSLNSNLKKIYRSQQ